MTRDRNSGSKSARPTKKDTLQDESNFATNIKPINKD